MARNQLRPGGGIKDARDDACTAHIEALRGSMSRGQLALEAVLMYRASALPCPEWALREIASCYSDFKTGARPGGWVRPALRQAAPKSLGDAFGTPENRGNMRGRRHRALLAPLLINAKQSDKTDARIADALGLDREHVRKLRKALRGKNRG